MLNTPKKVKTTLSLERISWIAGILSVVIALVAYFKPTDDASSASSINTVNSGEKSVVIQGNGNMLIMPQSASVTSKNDGRFIEIEISDHKLDLKGKSRHEVHFPQISGKISRDILDRINHFLKRAALTEYERYAGIDEVQISYVIGLKEFNLLGINFEIFASGDAAAHPLTSTNATTLDLETGSALLLKDFFRSGYVQRLNDLVRSELINRGQYRPCEKEGGIYVKPSVVSDVLESITGHPADACFKSVLDDGQYYLTDTSLVLVFPKYSVAPGSDGDIEIRIPFKVLQSVLKPRGPLQRFL